MNSNKVSKSAFVARRSVLFVEVVFCVGVGEEVYVRTFQPSFQLKERRKMIERERTRKGGKTVV
jgi:hypothetical protein